MLAYTARTTLPLACVPVGCLRVIPVRPGASQLRPTSETFHTAQKCFGAINSALVLRKCSVFVSIVLPFGERSRKQLLETYDF